MQEDPALGVIIQQPAHQPPALGGLGMSRYAVGHAHGPLAPEGARQGTLPSKPWMPAGHAPSNPVGPNLWPQMGAGAVFEATLIDPMETTGLPGTATPLEAPGISVPGRRRPRAMTRRPPGLRGVARGFSWGTAGQLIGVAGNLVLTPFIIHGLGVERYGIFVLVVTLTGMLTSFDGGVMGAAARYFAVYAGTDDRRSTTQAARHLLRAADGCGDCHQHRRLVPVARGSRLPQHVSDLAATGHFLVPHLGHPRHDAFHPHAVPASPKRRANDGRGAPLPASPLICSTSSGSWS